jgi:3-deoxy-D-manno-octulosonic-acid transferase
MGELPSFYAAAVLAVVGGTFRPFGGHNVAEPALFGVPVLFGPSIANCRLEAETLLAAGGGRQVPNDAGLAAALREELEPSRRARAVAGAGEALSRLRGATDRTLGWLVERDVIEAAS